MERFTVPRAGREFEAIELRRLPDGTHPIVDAATAQQVAASMGRRHGWVGRNLAVVAPGLEGEVVEVLRPDTNGHYDLSSISWIGEAQVEATEGSLDCRKVSERSERAVRA